jgi:hypothetical protein
VPLSEGVEYSGKIVFGTEGHLVPYKFVVDGSKLHEIVEHPK